MRLDDLLFEHLNLPLPSLWIITLYVASNWRFIHQCLSDAFTVLGNADFAFDKRHLEDLLLGALFVLDALECLTVFAELR